MEKDGRRSSSRKGERITQLPLTRPGSPSRSQSTGIGKESIAERNFVRPIIFGDSPLKNLSDSFLAEEIVESLFSRLSDAGIVCQTLGKPEIPFGSITRDFAVSDYSHFWRKPDPDFLFQSASAADFDQRSVTRRVLEPGKEDIGS